MLFPMKAGLTFLLLSLCKSQDIIINGPPRQPGQFPGDIRLPVSQRYQWQEAYGYCGEESLQIASMFYGTWVSSWTIRDMSILLKYTYFNRLLQQSDKGSQWFISTHQKDPILDALHLTYTPFDTINTPAPQYDEFMVWMKYQIQINKAPVMMGMYVQESNDKDFDHVAVGHGILSRTLNDPHYDPYDVLLYTPLQETTSSTQTEAGYYFIELPQTRAETDYSSHIFTIPKDYCYGVAVTGIQNQKNTFRTRVELKFNFPYENPSIAGCDRTERCFESRMLKAFVIISDLSVNEKYSLLRFDNPSLVPHKADEDYCSSPHITGRWDFVARSLTERIETSFAQLSIVTFRTVKACANWDNNINKGVVDREFTEISLIQRPYTYVDNKFPQLRSKISYTSSVYANAMLGYYFGDNFKKSDYSPPEMPHLIAPRTTTRAERRNADRAYRQNLRT